MSTYTIESLIESVSSYIYKLARSFSLSISSLEFDDLVQEGRMIVLERFDEALGKANPESFVCVCIKHRFMDMYVYEKRRRCLLLEDDAKDDIVQDVEEMWSHFVVEGIAQVANDLPVCAKEGTRYILHAAKGFSYQDIADLHGVSVSRVSMCVQKAREKLKRNDRVLHLLKEGVSA